MGKIESEELMIVEFRTPQHPSSLGINNNWGGASPLLARNVPKESLEQKYTRLNNTRTVDGIFTYPDDYYYYDEEEEQSHYPYSYSSQISASDYEPSKKRSSKRGRVRLLFKKLPLLFQWKKERTVTLGWNTKRRFRLWRIPMLRLDPQNKWPNGWC